MNTLWQGYYSNGITAGRKSVKVIITPFSLNITNPDGKTSEWLYNEIIQTQGFYKGEPIRLEKGEESLVIDDYAFLEVLSAVAPSYGRKFSIPLKRKKKFLLILSALISAASLVVGLYFFGIPALAVYLADKVPPSWEDSLGKSVIEEFTKDMEECGDKDLQRYSEEILKILNNAASSHPYTFKIHIVKDNTINALAAPGGHIVVFTGLLELTSSTEEFAGVMAHEMQHVLKRHTTKAIFENFSTYMLLSLLTGDISGITEVAHTLGNLRYSRIHEKKADEEGIKLLIKAKIDAKGMVNFFKTLEKKTPDMPGAFTYLSTHPLTKERIEYLEKRLESGKTVSLPLFPDIGWEKVKRSCNS